MSVLYIALPVAILLGGAALLGCLYCIRSGQYDEMESSSMRILIDDKPIPGEKVRGEQGAAKSEVGGVEP